MDRFKFSLAVLLLAAGVGAGVLSCRGRSRSDVLGVYTSAGHLQALASHRGSFVVFLSGVPFGREKAWDVDHLAAPAVEMDDVNASVFAPTAVSRSLAGFALASGSINIGSGAISYRAARLPDWVIVGTAGLLTVCLARTPLRRRRWARQGCCRQCGYDLRATPDRCPECGAAAMRGATGRADGAPPVHGLAGSRPRRLAVSLLTLVVAAVVAAALLSLASRAVDAARRAPDRDGETGPIVRLHDVADLTPALYDAPGDPAVRRYETAAEDPESPQNQASGILCFPAPPYAGAYPREVDERADRLRGFGEAVLRSTAAGQDGNCARALPRVGQVMVVAPRPAQAEVAQLLLFIRNPAAAGLTSIVAGETAPPSSAGAQDPDEKLAQLMPEVRFDGVTLEAAFEQLREAAKANLVVDWRALAESGVERDTPVKLHLWDLPLSRVLAVLLAAAAADHEDVRLGFRAEGGVIRVTTADVLARSGAVTRAYDVRRLLEQILADEATSAAATQPSGSAFGKSPDEVIEQIVDLIQEQVDPDSWRVNGGEIGHTFELAGRLFIRHTPEGHRAIEAALKTMADAILVKE